jgi:citrate synthase
MSELKERLFEKIKVARERKNHLVSEHADIVVDQVTIGKIFGGLRDLKCLVTDISHLDPYEGIRYQGFTLEEVMKALPCPKGADMPYVEGLLFLFLTGEMPTDQDVEDVIEELKKRRKIPDYVKEVIDSYPEKSHPMALLSAAVIAMQHESQFNKAYVEGMKKNDYWEPMYEDGLNLLAKLPEIAAMIYAKLYRNGKMNPSRADLDFGGDFANMMGMPGPYDDVSRMYFITHSDHEGGNVSAHTGHLVASSLSDIYLSVSAMINGLAGPLHGLASQDVLIWLQKLMDRMGDSPPDEDEVRQYVLDTIQSGRVIPGFGHAVLRNTDSRYILQRNFCLKHMREDPVFAYVDMLYRVVPPVLQQYGRVKNPWPNVDAQSGVIQWHYGVREYKFYTVLFAIGRAIGVTANVIWDRALGYPIERPKSLTTKIIEKIVEDKIKNEEENDSFTIK